MLTQKEARCCCCGPVRCTRAELSRSVVALGRFEKEVSNNKSSRGHWACMIDKMSPQKMLREGAALGGRCIWVSHMWVLHGLVKVASAYIRCAQSAAAKCCPGPADDVLVVSISPNNMIRTQSSNSPPLRSKPSASMSSSSCSLHSAATGAGGATRCSRYRASQ